MTTQSRITLKAYFNDGDQPTEANFADLIDSVVNIADDDHLADGIVPSGATVGATEQAQTFTVGLVIGPSDEYGILLNKGASSEVGNMALGELALVSVIPNPGGADVHSRYNVAIGQHALRYLETGSDNTALGTQALVSNVSGFQNTAVGHWALGSIVTGEMNTAIGAFAAKRVTGSYNIALGMQANYGATSGDDNIIIGYQARAAFDNPATGASNIAIGSETMLVATSAAQNVGVGEKTFYVLTTGATNLALGYQAGATLTTGTDNVMAGAETGGGVTTGNGNTILGARVGSLAAGLTNNIILANGTGAIKAQHNGTTWALSGNVGVGTAVTPDAPLHAKGGTAMTGGYQRTLTVEDLYPGLVFNGNATKWCGFAYDFSVGLNFFINAETNDVSSGSFAFIVLNSGNLGIGTATDGMTAAGSLAIAKDLAHRGTKVGLYNVTPVERATTAGAAATFTANSGTAVNDASTFDGYTLKQVVKALRDVGVLT